MRMLALHSPKILDQTFGVHILRAPVLHESSWDLIVCILSVRKLVDTAKTAKKTLKLVREKLPGIPWHAAAKSIVLEFPKNSNHLCTLRAVKHRALALYESACAFNVCRQSVQQFVGTAKIAKYRKLYPMTEK